MADPVLGEGAETVRIFVVVVVDKLESKGQSSSSSEFRRELIIESMESRQPGRGEGVRAKRISAGSNSMVVANAARCRRLEFRGR